MFLWFVNLYGGSHVFFDRCFVIIMSGSAVRIAYFNKLK